MSEYRKHINIVNGKLAHEGLQFQLHRQDGSKATLNYNGVGYINGRSIAIEVSHTYVIDLTIAEFATKESTERANGMAHAQRQVRMREPKNVSIDYLNGWREQWEWKKKGWA